MGSMNFNVPRTNKIKIAKVKLKYNKLMPNFVIIIVPGFQGSEVLDNQIQIKLTKI